MGKKKTNAISAATAGYANTLGGLAGGFGATLASQQSITTTSGTYEIDQLSSSTVQGNSGLTWTYDSTTTPATLTDPTIGIQSTGAWTTGTTTATWNIPSLEAATKEELQKIIKNQEVQIEINGEMKTCKLADLLNTGYLTLKTI